MKLQIGQRWCAFSEYGIDKDYFVEITNLYSQYKKHCVTRRISDKKIFEHNLDPNVDVKNQFDHWRMLYGQEKE